MSRSRNSSCGRHPGPTPSVAVSVSGPRGRSLQPADDRGRRRRRPVRVGRRRGMADRAQRLVDVVLVAAVTERDRRARPCTARRCDRAGRRPSPSSSRRRGSSSIRGLVRPLVASPGRPGAPRRPPTGRVGRRRFAARPTLGPVDEQRHILTRLGDRSRRVVVRATTSPDRGARKSRDRDGDPVLGVASSTLAESVRRGVARRRRSPLGSGVVSGRYNQVTVAWSSRRGRRLPARRLRPSRPLPYAAASHPRAARPTTVTSAGSMRLSVFDRVGSTVACRASWRRADPEDRARPRSSRT